ncbi:hypothetical protein BO70DRAFT_47396 [Aspergillus heteromorphus CBS 117.55]|uniref:Uncharacterized protein n=1 Tax=Aspergillus heteromorphus CBS 117.55 TaxID=1448321 RepID=A0A317W5R4_9EURO|nr:uncharacterized protein BO70DRAFT_47396 [Aspergillus heteromorphus CBS 117.55]PWY80662.1 hypothetical protein BO70DRAFT_47396 [Aspergillus heteromorphus CBS 117.55]
MVPRLLFAALAAAQHPNPYPVSATGKHSSLPGSIYASNYATGDSRQGKINTTRNPRDGWTKPRGSIGLAPK